ncbi:MAG: histidinol dehydrogenase [Acidimicrobiia bacterium]
MPGNLLTRIDVRGAGADLRAILAHRADEDERVADVAREIVEAVRTGGDAALRANAAEFDGAEIHDLGVDRFEWEAALERLEPPLRAALEFARDQILAWHEAQREKEARHERSGIHVRELVVPVDRAGCYVPGGVAPLASSLLMTAIPARVAGVSEVVVCSPSRADGSVDDAILAAAVLADVDELYRAGGAGAIAAMAYGTETIRPVDVIVGPGSAYTSAAKRLVAPVVGIDGFAGPSEVAIVCDASVDPALVAADLLAQAEHGPGGSVTVITWDDDVAERVDLALDALLSVAARRDFAAQTLAAGGRVVLVEDPGRALDVSNAIAPEHLELMCADADLLVPLVRQAGAVFVGADAPAVIGDYVAGVNHVLPTAGTARFASALRVADFQKHVHVVSLDGDALRRVAPFVRALAEHEGLSAHADAIRLREER